MKKGFLKKMVFFLAGLSTLIILGCSENNSLNQPDHGANSNVSKITPDALVNSSWTFLGLPAELGLNKGKGKKKTGWTVSKESEPDKKVKLKIKQDYECAHGKIEVEIKVDIEANAVPAGEWISMNFSTNIGIISFLPNMVYDKITKVSVKFKGLKLTDVTEDQINFVYLDVNGDYIAVDQKNVKVKYKDGEINEISVKDQDIPNVSRYAFTLTS
jgi:hypothetical protein